MNSVNEDTNAGLMAGIAFGCGVVTMSVMSVGSALAASGSAEQSPVTRVETATVLTGRPADPLQSIVIPRTADSAVRILSNPKSPPIRIDFGNFTTHVPTQNAGTTLNCATNSFHVSTGTKGGSCTVDYTGGSASCTDGSNTSTAKCGSGCGNTNGSGNCTQN